MYYVYIDSPQLAISRVADRVRKGGHHVPDEDVIRRYFTSLNNLKKAVKLCNEICILDNSTDAGVESGGVRILSSFCDGKLQYKADDIPSSFFDYLDSILEER